jgi:DNA polymerase-4
MPCLCRDCLAELPEDVVRCRLCASPRLVCHRELHTLSIAHIDCDAFYAAIEKRDNPALQDKPVIVGGGRRGVVAAACYVARTFGVKSAMPMFEALSLCPHAVVIPPDIGKYARVGRQVRSLMQQLTPMVEPLSIDEAFLDLSGTERLHGEPPASSLARFARHVETSVGITVSIGLAPNKFLAKIASDLDKPRGFSVLGRAEATAFLATKPVSTIFGVGNVMQARLARDGYRKISDLQAASPSELIRRYGTEGARLSRLSRGIDDRPVQPDRDAKSVSAETTFERDLGGIRPLERILWTLSERVSRRLKAQGLTGSTVTLKLKTADFRIRTRAHGLPHSTELAETIFSVARELLKKEADGTKFRLIGVGVSNLGSTAQACALELLDQGEQRKAAAERAIDRIREKFGGAVIVKGLSFDQSEGDESFVQVKGKP